MAWEMNLQAGVLAGFVLLLLGWLAWRRPDRRRLVWRVGANLVAGLSLGLLLYPPTYQKVLDASAVILLTEGYSKDTLAALLDTAAAKPLVFRYRTEAAAAEPVHNLYTLRQQHPRVQTVHLLGFGVNEPELQALNGTRIIPHLSRAPAGIQAVHWPEKIKEGEEGEVAGRFRGLPGETTILFLQAAGKAQDSVKMSGDSTLTFRLRYSPKQAGRFAHSLVSKSLGKTDTLGHVPVVVEEPDKVRVLLLASSPLFEFKFLKNHLARLQHQVALRTTISKGISQKEWLNRPRTNLDQLTRTLLQQFDLVITEPQTLQNLSSAERASLQQAVVEEGLGLLTIAGEKPTGRSTGFFTSFRTARVGQQESRTTLARWPGGAMGGVTALPIAFLKEEGVTGLVEEQNAQLLAASKRAGWGTVAITAIPQTFSWQLEGKESTYSSYWAHLLSAIAKKEDPPAFWLPIFPNIPQPRQPLTLTYTDFTLNEGAPLPAPTVLGLRDSSAAELAMAQNPLQPEQFTSTFRPGQKGWHVGQVPEAAPYYFFVHDSAEWAFAGIQSRLAATQKFISQQNRTPAERVLTYTEENVPSIWFFISFVLSSGFLWLEEKV